MSLIHDALKEMDRPGALDAADASALPPPPVGERRNVFAAVAIAFVAVLAAGGVAYAGWKMAYVPTVAEAAVPVPAAAMPVAATLPPPVLAPLAASPSDAVVVAVAEVPVRVAVVPALPVPSALNTSTASSVSALQAASPTVTVVPKQTMPAPARIRRERTDTSAGDSPAPTANRMASSRAAGANANAGADQVTAERRFALFLEAMRVRDLAGAERHLVVLRQQLTRSSLSLVRAEAWYAFSKGDIATARREYQEVLERLPGDEEASINLASIEAGQKQTEVARQILTEALRANPDSEVIKSTLATFGGRR